MSLAMAGVAYVIPTLILPEIISVYDTNIIELYENILLLGGVFYLLGMFVGYRSRMSLRRKGFLWENISTDSYCKKVSRLTIGLTQFAILGIILCFLAMGFVPLFAEDPIAAKFFREAYQDSYKKVAGLYRTCNYILQFTIPILVVLWFYYRKRIYILFCIYSLIILMGCVARSPAFSGLLVGIGIIVAYKKTLFKYYIFLLFLIYGIGSSFFYILGFSSYGLDSTASIFEIMINGAPDISDHLMFLTAFSDHPEHTYGRTFWGGLIPNHYYWNPSVWTLHVVNGGDINNIISGGLRLPLPIWGYVSFSWPGVVLLSGCVGFLSGKFIKKTKYMLDRGGVF
jgi:oligosaccharide repeat unit polymerase